MKSEDDIQVGDLVSFLDYRWDEDKQEEIETTHYSIVLGIRCAEMKSINDIIRYNLYRLALPRHSAHHYTEVTIDDINIVSRYVKDEER